MRTVCLGQDDQQLDAIAQRIRSAKRIVTVSGAGMSCSAGIPDFRSKDGLYNLVKEAHPDAVVKGQDLFDAGLFRSSKTTSIFFTFMANLKGQMAAAEPTPSHHFLRHLRDSDKLLRVYTQNIDGFEARAGLQDETVMLHGNIHRLRCTDCKSVLEWSSEHVATLGQGKAPQCTECRDMEAARRVAGLRKRPIGVLRPQVVLYNEEHPEATQIGTTVAKDARAKPDLLLIMGTSLKVDGIKGLVRDLNRAVKANGGVCVFVNATPVSGSLWNEVIDYHVQSGIDEWVADLKLRTPELWRKQTRLEYPPAKRRKPLGPAAPAPLEVGPEPVPFEVAPLASPESPGPHTPDSPIFTRVHSTWPEPMCSTRLSANLPGWLKSDSAAGVCHWCAPAPDSEKNENICAN